MEFQVEPIPVGEILVEERFRTNLGDINGLKESIASRGLLQPIIIGDDRRLIAGERRHKAWSELVAEGRIEDGIPAHVMGSLTREDRLVIELIENSDRKGFDWSEEVQLRRAIHQSFAAEHPEHEWSMRDTATKLGQAHSNISTDINIADACDAFPELMAYATKGQANEAYKRLLRRAEAVVAMKKMPDDEQAKLKQMMEGKYQLPTTPDEDDTSLKSAAPEFCYKICPWEEMLDELPKKSIGFVEMDPPYAMDFENTYGQSSNQKVDFKDWSSDEFTGGMNSLLKKLKPHLIDDSWLLIWTAFEWVPFLTKMLNKHKYTTQRPGIWLKPGGTTNAMNTNLMSNYEVFMLARHGNAKFNSPGVKAGFQVSGVSGKHKAHPTEKPVLVYDELIPRMAKAKTIGFSPFAGSGNALISMAKAGMIPVGCDLRSDYVANFIQQYNRAFSKTTLDDAK